jgi:hypothetical protein
VELLGVGAKFEFTAITRVQHRFSRVLSHGILKIRLASLELEPTWKNELKARKSLENDYGCGYRADAEGAVWMSYMRKARRGIRPSMMSWKLIRRLVAEYRVIPGGKMTGQEELAREKLLKVLIAFKDHHEAHDKLVEPDFMTRLRLVKEELKALKSEALESDSEIKQGAILDVLEPVVEELGG